MKLVYCPVCGGKLLEGESNSKVKIKCNKCKSIQCVVICSDKVEITLEKDGQNTTK